jgi:hypothetical protein
MGMGAGRRRWARMVPQALHRERMDRASQQLTRLGHHLGRVEAGAGAQGLHDADVEAPGPEGRVGDVDEGVTGGKSSEARAARAATVLPVPTSPVITSRAARTRQPLMIDVTRVTNIRLLQTKML